MLSEVNGCQSFVSHYNGFGISILRFTSAHVYTPNVHGLRVCWHSGTVILLWLRGSYPWVTGAHCASHP